MKALSLTVAVPMLAVGTALGASVQPPLAVTNDYLGVKVVVNYDPDKIAPYKLEDPLRFMDGSPVETKDDWRLRRQEILDLFAHEMYGVEPPRPEAIITDLVKERVTCDGYAVRRQYAQYFRTDRSGPCVNWFVWLPRGAQRRVPVILFLNYRGAHEYVTDEDVPVMSAWSRNGKYVKDHRASAATRGLMLDQNNPGTTFPLQTILARGYAVMTACYCEVSPDPNWDEPAPYGQDGFAYTGVFDLWGGRDESRTDNITSLGAWAWALSRGLDLAERIPEVNARCSVVTGCSRLGKAALIAAARDDRFAVCVPNQCGGGGVCLAKRNYGESVKTEVHQFSHWYCRAYAKYAEDPAGTLPFDQHLFLATIAPRPVLVEGMSDSRWMDTEAEFLACRAAAPVWRFLGCGSMPDVDYPENYSRAAIGERLGYVRRPNAHGISGFDWNCLLDFADRQPGFDNRARRGAVRPFADGERVTFLGDSITHGGSYHVDLQLYWDLRHPGSGTRLMNCGISGDSAEGGAKRWSWDAAPQRSNRTFVMFGMNDIGRNDYGVADPDAKVLGRRAQNVAKFTKYMAVIADCVQSSGQELVLMTPTPFDQYGTNYMCSALPGANETGLAACASAVRRLASSRLCGLVELHRPLTALVRRQDAYCFCNKVDRVHPRADGHLIMMAEMLKAMDEPAEFGGLDVDAAGRRDFEIRYVPGALPFPITEEYREADRVYPLTETVNREMLVVRNLPIGRYRLMAGGVALGTYSETDFSAGVNLAVLPTPGARLAKEAWKVSRSLLAVQAKRRGIALVENTAMCCGADRKSFSDVCAKLETQIARYRAERRSWAGYYEKQLLGYRQNKPQECELEDEENRIRGRLAEIGMTPLSYVLQVSLEK